MGRVVLLTGSPAAGKSTLRMALSAIHENLIAVDYGEELIRLKSEEGHDLTYEELREHSAAVINPAHVLQLDERVIARVQSLRESADVLIDSHAVTREIYGFRAVPFCRGQLERLRLDVVLVLRCDPETTLARIKAAAAGRQNVTLELAREHQAMQQALALTYATVCGCPMYVLDSSAKDAQDILRVSSEILQRNGFNF